MHDGFRALLKSYLIVSTSCGFTKWVPNKWQISCEIVRVWNLKCDFIETNKGFAKIMRWHFMNLCRSFYATVIWSTYSIFNYLRTHRYFCFENQILIRKCKMTSIWLQIEKVLAQANFLEDVSVENDKLSLEEMPLVEMIQTFSTIPTSK